MISPQYSCGAELIANASRLWLFLKSQECQMLFLVLATIRALFYYLLRSPLREARELAYTMALTALFSGMIAISEAPRPQWFTKLATYCVDHSRFASRDMAPSSADKARREPADRDR